LATIAAVVLAALAAAAWVVGRPALARLQDVAARRAAYQAFPVFPGSEKLGERSYEVKGDGVGTGEYGLTVTYRLPAGAVAAEVISFLRASIPPGWHEATDETCAGVAATMPPAPLATVPPGEVERPPPTSAFGGRLVLMQREGELAVFAPEGGPGERPFRGVTFKVLDRGERRFLTLDQVTFACEPG
jgi:hypothetical protein